MVKHGGSVTTKHKEFVREQTQKTQSTLLKASRRPLRGYIKAMKPAEGNDYYHEVQVRVDGLSSTNKDGKISTVDSWLPLAEDPAVIAMLYGDKDMILNTRCRIEFSDASPRTGLVFIERDRGRVKPRKQATELDQKAFLYATAGGGKLF